MKPFRVIGFLLLCLCVIVTQASGTPDTKSQIIESVGIILGHMDQSDFASLYEKLESEGDAAFLRDQIKKHRESLGKSRCRNLQKVIETEEIPGYPKKPYLVLVYLSEFSDGKSHNGSIIEVVIVRTDSSDNKEKSDFKICGYYFY